MHVAGQGRGEHHSQTLGAECAEQNFSLCYTGTGVGGDRHLVTAPPPPGGGRPDIRGGGLQGGWGVVCKTFECLVCDPLYDTDHNVVFLLLLHFVWETRRLFPKGDWRGRNCR